LVEFRRSVLFPTTTDTLPAALQSAYHSTRTGPAVTLHGVVATVAHPPTTALSIIGEYHRELQQIVDETFNKKHAWLAWKVT
jgi:hypothetical protein